MMPLPAHIPATAAAPGECPGLACKFWVSEQGLILDSCAQLQSMFGYRKDELNGLPISRLLPALADTPLTRGGRINPRLAFMCRCATPFRTLDRDGGEGCCTLFVNLVTLRSGPALAVIVCTQPYGGDD